MEESATPVRAVPDDVSTLPVTAGIYAIINNRTGDRYVGQACNVRRRIAEHVRDLNLGVEATNADLLLQKAWTRYGKDAFVIEVLEEVTDNRGEFPYRLRPDNLALAEHYYISQGAAYNKDSHIVSAEFAHLVESRAWRLPFEPSGDSTIRPYTYVVTERGGDKHAVIVFAFDEREAKRRAASISSEIATLGNTVAARRIGPTELDACQKKSVRDGRHL
jgi:hypothetical protein